MHLRDDGQCGAIGCNQKCMKTLQPLNWRNFFDTETGGDIGPDGRLGHLLIESLVV